MSNLYRTIQRNRVKKEVGNNRISMGWERLRRNIVGDDHYEADMVRCDPKRRQKMAILTQNGQVIRRKYVPQNQTGGFGR